MTSIEKVPVLLSIRGEQYFEGVDPDATELMTEGTMELTESGTVSYTHLDVYKRQHLPQR